MRISPKYKPLFWLILVSTIIRSFIAQFIELGNDEVYYFTYALYPEWSHFDHPPMVGWVIQLFSFNQFLESQFLLRLPAIIFAAANTWLIFKLGEKIKDEITGWYAALLYTSSLYATLIAGIFIMPDSPQLFFWVLSLYLMIDVLSDKDLSKVNKNKFLLLGLLIGFGMLSKYTSIFLWGGIFLYIIIYNRNWFKTIYLYLSGIISLIVFSPVLWWNNKHHFISFTFHEDRVSLVDSGIRFDFIGTEILGEFLYQNPVVFVLVWMSLIFLVRKKGVIMEANKLRILLFQSLPLIGVFLFFSLFRKTLPHWTGPAYISLIMIAAAYLSRNKKTILFPKPIKSAIYTLLGVLIIGIAQINYGIIDLAKYTGSDLTLDMYGWRDLNKQFDELKSEKELNKQIQKDAPIISYRWFPAAHIDYYVAIPNNTHVLGLGSLERIHKYAWMNEERGGYQLGMDAWYLAFDYDYVSPYFLEPYFTTIVLSDTIQISRAGNRGKQVYVYFLKDLKKLPKSDFKEFMQKAKSH